MDENIKWTSGTSQAKEKSDQEAVSQFFEESAVRKTRQFIESFPKYDRTPLRSLKQLAAALGVGGIYVKDESYRFGLNSFKVLGGGHAIGRYLGERLGLDTSELIYEKLQSAVAKDKLGQLTFTSATDGNHGRGVAWAAGQLGHRAVINMPKGSSLIRLQHITDTGAEGHITEVNYDETVRLTAENARQRGWIMIQDTAWEGYENIPNWVMQGYTVMVAEALEQLNSMQVERPTHLFIQAGVGSLAAAVTGYSAAMFGTERPITAVIEAQKADCFYRSATTGEGYAVKVRGDLDTIMAGLACGEPNPVAWKILWQIADLFISCPDYIAANGMRILGNPLPGDRQVISGESGAVTTGTLCKILRDWGLEELKEELALNQSSHILLFSTEGNTDPEMYRRIVWDGAYPDESICGKSEK